MKKAMSGFDLRAMARELDALKGAYIKKAYMPHYEQIVLRVNPKEAEQRDIVFVRGERVYTSQRDRPMPMTPPPFAMVLRKHLRNARLTGVEQVGFDRVLSPTERLALPGAADTLGKLATVDWTNSAAPSDTVGGRYGPLRAIVADGELEWAPYDDDEGSEMVFDWARALGSVLCTTATTTATAMATSLRKLKEFL